MDECPLLAQSGHANSALECPLSGVNIGRPGRPTPSRARVPIATIPCMSGTAMRRNDTERNMLGAVLIAAVLNLVTCSTPVLAQKMSCEQFCRAHCSGAAI